MKIFKVLKRKYNTFKKTPALILIKPLVKLSFIFDDELYLKALFRLKMKKKLNLEDPSTFSEKLQWLKINYRNPRLTIMVDKYEAKEFVKSIVGDEYIVNNYGVWDTFEQINFEELPNQFVLKTTHDQGGVVICKDKRNFDYKQARNLINKHLKFRHYYLSREWPYKNVKPRIIAEELLKDNQNNILWDYKFYCFNGIPKVMFIATERGSGNTKFDYFDMNFKPLDIQQGGECSGNKFVKPINFDVMIEVAAKLSKDLPHVRIDFYEVNNKLYFGEATFFDSGGLAPFNPQEWDYTFGSWIDLL